MELLSGEKIWGWCNASRRNGFSQPPFEYLEGPGLTRLSPLLAPWLGWG